jgi:hypothetical protein
MRDEDAATVAGLVRTAQEGRRLVPHKIYRGHRFGQEVDQPGSAPSGDG